MKMELENIFLIHILQPHWHPGSQSCDLFLLLLLLLLLLLVVAVLLLLLFFFLVRLSSDVHIGISATGGRTLTLSHW